MDIKYECEQVNTYVEKLRKFTSKKRLYKTEKNVFMCMTYTFHIEQMIDHIEHYIVERFRKTLWQGSHEISQKLDKLEYKEKVKLIGMLDKRCREFLTREAQKDGMLLGFLKTVNNLKMDIIGTIAKDAKKIADDNRKESKDTEAVFSNQDAFDVAEALFDLFIRVYRGFNTIKGMREMLKAEIEKLREVKWTKRKNAEIEAKEHELRILAEKLDNDYSDTLGIMITYIKRLLFYAETKKRYDTFIEDVYSLVNPKKEKHVLLSDKCKKLPGMMYVHPKKLGINYQDPVQTFDAEVKRIVFPKETTSNQKGVVFGIIRKLMNLVIAHFRTYCNDAYHGVEHTSQVIISSLRLFEGYNKYSGKKLTLMDFFVLMTAAIFHDTGYWIEHHVYGSLPMASAMNHVGHEKRSAVIAERYLLHYKEDKAFGDADYAGLVKSTQNVITYTQLFAQPDDASKDNLLGSLIQAADLMEGASEHYIDMLVPLYLDCKLGNPKAPWPDSLFTLLSGTPGFIEGTGPAGTPVKTRLFPIIKKGYFQDYWPDYYRNININARNIEKLCSILKPYRIEKAPVAA